jgi:hypothetical protein
VGKIDSKSSGNEEGKMILRMIIDEADGLYSVRVLSVKEHTENVLFQRSGIRYQLQALAIACQQIERIKREVLDIHRPQS